MYGIFDAGTGELIEGGFFEREAAVEAANEYQERGLAVDVRKQRRGK